MLMLLGALWTMASGAARAADSASLTLRGEVTIDAEGRVRSLEWHDRSPLHALVAQRVEDTVNGWEFDPGRVDGAPAETRSGMSIHVALERKGRDLALRLQHASTGPVVLDMTPPEYPKGAAREQAEAELSLILDLAPDGTVQVSDAALVGRRRSRWNDEFIAAATQAASRWRFQPETVGGRPVAARMRVPVDFFMCNQCPRNYAQRAPEPTGSDPVALDSAVRLRTDIHGQEI